MLDFKWVFSTVSILFSVLEAASTLSHSSAYQQFKQFTTPTLRCQRQTVKRGKTKCLPTSLSDYWTLLWLISEQCYNCYVSNGNAFIAMWYVEMYIRLYCYMSNRNAHGISFLFSLPTPHPPPLPVKQKCTWNIFSFLSFWTMAKTRLVSFGRWRRHAW